MDQVTTTFETHGVKPEKITGISVDETWLVVTFTGDYGEPRAATMRRDEVDLTAISTWLSERGIALETEDVIEVFGQ